MTTAEAPKLILVADDQGFIRSLLISMLRELGYRTLDASDGYQAMQQLAGRPHMAILDQRMAGYTGLEILQAVRSGRSGQPRDLPVLLLTGHADEEIVRIAGELDVSAFLSKPVSKTQLKARLEMVAKTPLMLRSPQSYAVVDVKPVQSVPAARTTGNGWLLKRDMHPLNAPYTSAADLARRASAAARAARDGETHYSRIRAGMVLKKDLYSASGRLIVAAGLELTEDMVKRLVGLCEANPALHYLNVAESKETKATS